MSYMDQRAVKDYERPYRAEDLQVSRRQRREAAEESLVATHAASTSVKDPLWKYKWVEANEPDIFNKVHKWLDVKEYLIARCTGNFVMTKDSAYSTFLYDTRKGQRGLEQVALQDAYGV